MPRLPPGQKALSNKERQARFQERRSANAKAQELEIKSLRAALKAATKQRNALPKMADAAKGKRMSADWEVIGRDVIPRNDLVAHSLGEGCWCKPTYDEGVLVHHSMDRREEYEQGRKKQ